jgi:hypothetical protein
LPLRNAATIGTPERLVVLAAIHHRFTIPDFPAAHPSKISPFMGKEIIFSGDFYHASLFHSV